MTLASPLHRCATGVTKCFFSLSCVLIIKANQQRSEMASFGSLRSAIFGKEERKQQYQDHIRGLNAYDRHKKFVNDYAGFYGRDGSTHEKLPVRTDHGTLKEGYRFVVSDMEESPSATVLDGEIV